MNIFKLLFRTFLFQGCVYFSASDKPTRVSNKIKWLEVISVKGLTWGSAENKALKIFNKKYPEYKGMVQIY
jgi:hypothetical protein